jgi:hypothetical protein
MRSASKKPEEKASWSYEIQSNKIRLTLNDGNSPPQHIDYYLNAVTQQFMAISEGTGPLGEEEDSTKFLAALSNPDVAKDFWSKVVNASVANQGFLPDDPYDKSNELEPDELKANHQQATDVFFQQKEAAFLSRQTKLAWQRVYDDTRDIASRYYLKQSDGYDKSAQDYYKCAAGEGARFRNVVVLQRNEVVPDVYTTTPYSHHSAQHELSSGPYTAKSVWLRNLEQHGVTDVLAIGEAGVTKDFAPYFPTIDNQLPSSSALIHDYAVSPSGGGKTIIVHHIPQFPDFGTLDFSAGDVKKLLGILQDSQKLRIHCRAGIGRSGVFELAFTLFEQYDQFFSKDSAKPDIAAIQQQLEKLRIERPGLVQKPEQLRMAILLAHEFNEIQSVEMTEGVEKRFDDKISAWAATILDPAVLEYQLSPRKTKEDLFEAEVRGKVKLKESAPAPQEEKIRHNPADDYVSRTYAVLPTPLLTQQVCPQVVAMVVDFGKVHSVKSIFTGGMLPLNREVDKVLANQALPPEKKLEEIVDILLKRMNQFITDYKTVETINETLSDTKKHHAVRMIGLILHDLMIGLRKTARLDDDKQWNVALLGRIQGNLEVCSAIHQIVEVGKEKSADYRKNYPDLVKRLGPETLAEGKEEENPSSSDRDKRSGSPFRFS